MLMMCIQTALRHAKYEILDVGSSFYGEIPVCNGVYASASTLEECRKKLEEVIEECILLRVYKNLPLPVVDGIELTIKEIV